MDLGAILRGRQVFLLILMQLNMQTFASYQSGININFQVALASARVCMRGARVEWHCLRSGQSGSAWPSPALPLPFLALPWPLPFPALP